MSTKNDRKTENPHTNRKWLVLSAGAKQKYGHSNDYTRGLCIGLVEHQIVPTIVCLPGPLPIHEQIQESLLPVSDLRRGSGLLSRVLWGMRRSFSGFRAGRHLLRLSKQQKYEFLILETFDYLAMAFYSRRIRRYVRILAIFHDTNFNTKQSTGLAKLYKATIARGAARRVAANSHHIFVHGDSMLENLRSTLGLFTKKYDDAVSVLPHGSLHPAQVPTPLGSPTPLAPSHLANMHSVLLFGTLRRDKNYHLLFRLLTLLDDWVLLVVGPEGDFTYSELTSLAHEYRIEDRVIPHASFVAKGEQVGIFEQVDLVACLYFDWIRHESGTAQQARSFLKPLLVSGPPDLCNYVEDNAIGFVVTEDRLHSVAELVRSWIGDPTSRLAMQDRIHDVACKYSWERVTETVIEIAQGNC